jgi:hypothetical protein
MHVHVHVFNLPCLAVAFALISHSTVACARSAACAGIRARVAIARNILIAIANLL